MTHSHGRHPDRPEGWPRGNADTDEPATSQHQLPAMNGAAVQERDDVMVRAVAAMYDDLSEETQPGLTPALQVPWPFGRPPASLPPVPPPPPPSLPGAGSAPQHEQHEQHEQPGVPAAAALTPQPASQPAAGSRVVPPPRAQANTLHRWPSPPASLHRAQPPPANRASSDSLLVPHALLNEVDQAVKRSGPRQSVEETPSSASRTPPSRPQPPAPPEAILTLVWHSEECPSRLAAEPIWQRYLLEHDFGPSLGEEGDDGSEPVFEESMLGPEQRARGHVFHVLARAPSVPLDSLTERLRESVDRHGKLTPPLIKLTGELATPFDARMRLDMTIACAAPFASTDRGLAEAVQSARDMLDKSGKHAPAELLDRLQQRVERSFEERPRPVESDYLRKNVTRLLLEERAYQLRAVYGESHLRMLLYGEAEQPPVPVYLPQSLANQLPMMARFPARLLAELDVRQDGVEASALALRAQALARVCGDIFD